MHNQKTDCRPCDKPIDTFYQSSMYIYTTRSKLMRVQRWKTWERSIKMQPLSFG